jgi:hypothetical protein
MKNQHSARVEHTVMHDVSLLTDHDIYLFKQGNHFKLYEKLGAHLIPMLRQSLLSVTLTAGTGNLTC